MSQEPSSARADDASGERPMIGRSPAMDRVFDLIERVAPQHANVLITGETGTGKELVARAVHRLSGRDRKPFIPVNCSALPATLLESELFGHVRGSFTGAVAARRGRFERAAGGTLFLDEVSTLEPDTQVKLLRVLEDRAIEPVGSAHRIPVDFRLVAATNQDLAERVDAGTFREDLYYRLNVFPIRVPPLRERREDIPLLARHFAERFGRPPLPRFSDATMRRMLAWDWPGNVRELENFVERAMILYAGADEIHFEPLDGLRHQPALVRHAVQNDWDLERLEREYILAILEKTHGHQTHAAEILGIDRRTLYRKLREIDADVAGPAGTAPAP